MSAGIEAARLFLALSVALFHWNGLLPSAYLAVDLFFVISGFVIARRYEAGLRAGGASVEFAVSRVIRLYPLYALSIALGLCSALFEPVVTSDGSYSLLGLIWRSLLLIPVLDTSAQPFGIQSFPLNNPVWSLWCEALASLLFCALCRLPRWAMLVPAFLGAAILVATAVSTSSFSAGGDGRTVIVGLGRIGFSFFAGVSLLRLPRSATLTGWRSSLSLAALLGMLLLYFRVTDATPDTLYSVLTVLVGVFPVLTLCIASCQLQGKLAQFCIVGGSLSYAIYILHWPLFRLIRWGAITQAEQRSLGATMGVILLLLGVSYVATRYVDAPLRRYLNAIRRDRVLLKAG